MEREDALNGEYMQVRRYILKREINTNNAITESIRQWIYILKG